MAVHVASSSLATAISSQASSRISVEVPAEPVEIPQKKPSNVRGVYLTPNSVSDEDFLEDTLARTVKGGGNALVFDVKGSAVFFDAASPLARELGLVQKRYNLKEVIDLAHARGVYVIGRYIAVKDAGLTRVRPDTVIVHPKTGTRIGYEYVDPANETALEYNRQILCDLAKIGIDEVNLDYIRFSTEQVGALRSFSTEQKAERIGTFVRMAREAIDECGSSTKLGISTFAILGWSYEVNVATLGQDVVRFAPYVDVISPMAYPSTFAPNEYYIPGKHKGTRNYYLVWRTLTGYQELLGEEHAHKLRPWIQAYGMTQKGIQDQMQAVADAGLCGFTLWNADNAYLAAYKALPSWVKTEECL